MMNASPCARDRLLLLQSITLAWMLIECAVSLFSAVRAHSPALLAFGFDSFVELLSALLVLIAASPRFRLNHRPIDTASGVLLFLLAAVVGLTSLLGPVRQGSARSKPSRNRHHQRCSARHAAARLAKAQTRAPNR